MSDIEIPMRCINHIGIVLLAGAMVACGPAAKHKIITEEKGFMQVDLEAKAEPAELIEVARYYYDPENLADGHFMINFFVSSAYPDYPETPWATVWMNGRDFDPDEPEVSLRINGTRNEMEKQNLCNIEPGVDGIKGKWYFNEPLLESVYFLLENADDTLMLVFDAKEYYEIVGEAYNYDTWNEDEVAGRSPVADVVYELSPGTRANEYCVLPYTEPSYRINEKGELILLDRQKSWKDTSRCVLQPIPQ